MTAQVMFHSVSLWFESLLWHFNREKTDWPDGNAAIKRSKSGIVNGPGCCAAGSALMKIGEMMLIWVLIGPTGVCFLCRGRRAECVVVVLAQRAQSPSLLAHAQEERGCVLTRNSRHQGASVVDYNDKHTHKLLFDYIPAPRLESSWSAEMLRGSAG